MNANDILKDAMKTADFRQVDLQQAMGFASQSRISAMLKSDLQVSTFVRALNVMGYDVTVTGHNREWTL